MSRKSNIQVLLLATLFTHVLLAQPRMIAHITQASGGFDTQIHISNSGTVDRSVVLIPFNSAGEALPEVQLTLSAGTTECYVPTDLFGQMADLSHVLLAEGSRDLLVWVAYEDQLGLGNPAHVTEAQTHSRVWRVFPGDWTQTFDGLALVNTGHDHATITIEQLNFDGQVVAQKSVTADLAPMAKTLYVLGAPAQAKFQALEHTYFQINSDQPLAVTSLRGTPPGTHPGYLWENPAIPLVALDAPEHGLSCRQRADDFESLVHMINKKYAPLQWKQQLLGVDILHEADLTQQMIMGTTTDEDYLDLAMGFLSRFQDPHTSMSIASNHVATLGFLVDLYDGRLLVDSVPSDFPFDIGDELVSIDGESALDRLEWLKKYTPSGFDRATRRLAAALLTYHVQSLMSQPMLAEQAQVEIQHQDGTQAMYTLPWLSGGTPYTSGTYSHVYQKSSSSEKHALVDQWDWISPFSQAKLESIMDINLFKYGHFMPWFDLPQGFEFLREMQTNDELVAGTYEAQGKTIGLLRIPKMFVNQQSQYQRLVQFIERFKTETDGLVIDIMNNPGGRVSWSNFVNSYLHTEPFEQILFQARPLLTDILTMEQYLNQNLDPVSMEFVQRIHDETLRAYRAGDHLTQPLSFDSAAAGSTMMPAMDSAGQPMGYDKPIVVLINELAVSGGDYFAATLQDSGRATLIGLRTSGGGGHVVSYDQALPYSEASFSLTESLMVRPNTVQVEGYPATRYIENVGVHPDVTYDYQTRENLIHGGQEFVDFFTDIILSKIEP